MENLPHSIKRIDILRVEYGKRKLCECRSPHYEIDFQNKLVTCTDCGAIVEPFEVLLRLARDYERLGDQVSYLLEQKKEIMGYKPYLVIMKKLESQYRANDYSMIPLCPKCGEPFDLADLNSWVNRKFVKEN